MPTSTIGEFEFRRLSKPPAPVERSLTVVAHPGKDGVQVWDDGQRGMAFSVRSDAVLNSIDEGHTLYTLYKQLKGEPPVSVRWASLEVSNTKFKVLDVQIVDEGLKPVHFGVGPGGERFYGVLMCDWRLLPIDVTPAEE